MGRKPDPRLIKLCKALLTVALPAICLFSFMSKVISDIAEGWFEDWLKFIGAFVTLKIGYNALKLVHFYYLKPTKDLSSYGRWAVITGSTSGIGEVYAHYLADKGINILLIGRSPEKLKKLATTLLGKHNIEVEYIIHDFSVDDQEVVMNFKAVLEVKLNDLSERGGIGILINSVGVANRTPTLVHEMNPEDIRQMLFINNNGTILMTRSVLPHMISRKSGAIITISSASSAHPSGLLSVYSATKAFGNQLTRSMYYEYKEYGIDTLSITPYYFVSNLFVRKEGSFLAPMPDIIVENSTKYLGFTSEANPYIGHKIIFAVISNYIFGYEHINKALSLGRKRRLAKLEKGEKRI